MNCLRAKVIKVLLDLFQSECMSALCRRTAEISVVKHSSITRAIMINV